MGNEVKKTIEPLVTVRCLCYNHSKYLRDALDGIVNQKTNFPFIAIIHDDASTDGSQEIIKEYADKYPNIIKPILQTENQYCKNNRITKTFIEPLINSKYTAVCECDDFWTDLNKLQIQVDYMEAHPECSLTCHAYDVVDSNGAFISHNEIFGSGDRDLSEREIILNENLPQTATVLYRQSYRNITPNFYFNTMVGDYPLYLHMFTCGKVHYFDITMSSYRRHGNNSWVTRTQADPKRFRKHVDLLNELVRQFDIETGGKYHDLSLERIELADYRALLIEKDLNAIIKNGYFSRMPLKKKMRVFLKLILNR